MSDTKLGGAGRKIGKTSHNSAAIPALAFMALFSFAGPAAAEPPELGIWYDDTGKGAVKISICESGDSLCGHIFWLKEPLNAAGKPLTDKNNPKAERRAQRICGLQVLGNVRPLADGSYDGGWVYDPKVGKAYDVAIKLTSPERLEVTGYIGVKFLSKKLIWTRAEIELPDCSTLGAADAQPAPPAQKKAGEAKPAQKNAADAKPASPTQKKAADKSKTGKADSGEALPWSGDGPKPATTKAKPAGQAPAPAAAASE